MTGAEDHGSPARLRFRIDKGLDVPIGGAPGDTVEDGPPIASVGVLLADGRVREPSLAVRDGQAVRLGERLFEDRANPGVVHTAPAAGVVRIVRRDERSEPTAVVVEVEGSDAEPFPERTSAEIGALDRDAVRALLLRSGLWTAFRTRPFGAIPRPAAVPAAVLVRAIDTDPLAVPPLLVIDAHRAAFRDGLLAIGRLVDCPIYVCTQPAATIPTPLPARARIAEFDGPHPAGLVGTHLQCLVPAVGAGATAAAAPSVWHLGYQDVIAIGMLLRTGRLWTERVVALGGPGVRRPRLVRTRLGASTSDLLRGELVEGECRVISGSVLSGRTASGPAVHLGRYHLQVSVLLEPRARAPVRRRMRREAFTYFGRRLGRRRPATAVCSTPALHGTPGAMVAVEAFADVTPLDLPIAPLLRALVVGDVERARLLGCVGLEEEDLALCAFVCPAKIDYGRLLRAALDAIEGAA